MKLTQEVVDKYARFSRRETRYRKLKEALRIDLLPILATRKSPAQGPFILVYSAPEQPDWSWKERYIELLAKTKEISIEDAEAKAIKLQAKAPKKVTPTINVEPNPKWKG